MLILSRRLDECILAGVVKFQIVAIRGDNVRIGIDAPGSVPVFREEVLLRMGADDLAAKGYEINASGLVVPRSTEFRSVSVSHPLTR